MDKEINNENYLIKKSYYVCSNIVNILWVPALIYMVVVGRNFYTGHEVGPPTDLIGWGLVITSLIYMVYLFIRYWNNKISFVISTNKLSIKSYKYEMSFPTNCITDVQVPVDFWHRTIFELFGNYYRLKITVDKKKLYAGEHIIIGEQQNFSMVDFFNLSGLSKKDALEVANKINSMIIK